MKKKGSKGFAKVATCILAGILLVGTVKSRIVAAETYTVKECKSIMYTNDKATVYTSPDFNSVLVTTISPDLPVDVTGVTSNGWFRIDLEGTYYIPGYGLEEKANKSKEKSYGADEITKLTKGTFSFFTNSQLRAFSVEDVQKMDANHYIKYLDSYLMGNATIDNCILGKTYFPCFSIINLKKKKKN